MLHPVFIGQQGKAVRAPARAPGVLHHEALLVVAHQREGVAAGLFGLGHGLDAHQVGVALELLAGGHGPAFVHGGRHVDRTVLENGGLQVDHRTHVDAVVHAQRARERIDVPVVLGVVGQIGVFKGGDVHAAALAVELVGPQVFPAHAVAVPALERAAAARAFVVLAWPLVVHARELVEHGGADLARLDLGLLQADHEAQVVDDGGQAEAGAGPFGALVEHQLLFGVLGQVGFDPVLGRPFRWQVAQGRCVGAVSQVEPVRAGVE